MFSPVWIVFILSFVYAGYLCLMIYLEAKVETITLEEKFDRKVRAADFCAMLLPSFAFAVGSNHFFLFCFCSVGPLS